MTELLTPFSYITIIVVLCLPILYIIVELINILRMYIKRTVPTESEIKRHIIYITIYTVLMTATVIYVCVDYLK